MSAVWVTGTKSLNVSYGSLGRAKGLIVKLGAMINMVCPSAGARATISAPMAVFAFAAYLFDHYGSNPRFADSLGSVAFRIGAPTATGELGVLNQYDFAMRALGGQ